MEAVRSWPDHSEMAQTRSATPGRSQWSLKLRLEDLGEGKKI